MRNIIFVALLMPAICSAQGEPLQFMSGSYDRVSVYGSSIDGYGIGYMAVQDNFSFSLNSSRFSEFGETIVLSSLGFDFGLGSFNDGAFYIGVGGSYAHVSFWDEATSLFTYSAGYSKRSGRGLDYDISATHGDGETSFGFLLRGQIGEDGLGWTLGAATNGDNHSQTAGLNYQF